MTIWLRIESGIAVESTDINPANRFHEDLIWVEASNGAQIGWLYANSQFSAPPGPSLDSVRSQKNAELTLSYDSAVAANVSYMNTTFQADDESRIRLNQVITACAGMLPDNFYWVDSQNNQIQMTFAQLQGLGAVMLAQGWTAFQNLQAKKSTVRAASDIDAVQSVTW